MKPRKLEKLLIVDDNDDLRKMLKFTFGYGNFKLLEASSGMQAIDLAMREVPDVIILDLMMPGIDGLEVCRNLKAVPQLASTYIIMLTARDMPSDFQRGMEAGADFYLTKPFQPTALIQIVEAVRSGKKSAGEVDDFGTGIGLGVSDHP